MSLHSADAGLTPGAISHCRPLGEGMRISAKRVEIWQRGRHSFPQKVACQATLPLVAPRPLRGEDRIVWREAIWECVDRAPLAGSTCLQHPVSLFVAGE